eukprot:CAMPEP_0202690570 /NCGR_PEP_ID=MMETSP1385-20130828/5514_1 /ASSEMBLY_ACC=CAM_ASM_000861 /TAXON_ID=933848 /ORGANISM="Elphidium margaritaceum" /LENGTH=593 /DNA_ID=CAMNT_0049345845 /DNA_START=44 /DNA_END=1825 /DNA_ORIENTATION=-
MASTSDATRQPHVGDIVLLKQGIGVVRYYGEVDFDESNLYYGIELKGPRIAGGHNGTYAGKRYFTTTGGDGRGIFVRTPIRVITSEEILEKLAEIYDILKGRRGHSHFIDRATYDELYSRHEELKTELNDKNAQLNDLSMDLSLLKEQVSIMKGALGDKIDETAQMTEKISTAERKLGSRLSQLDMSGMAQKLLQEEADAPLSIPDYSLQNGNGAHHNNNNNNNTQQQQQQQQQQQPRTGHRKQRSSTTIELDQLNDDFGDIARNVQAFGNKNKKMMGPTHYRKFSNTTKEILDQQRAKTGMIPGQYNRIHGNNAFGMQPFEDGQEESPDASNNYNTPATASSSMSSTPQTTTKKGGGHRARGSVQIGDFVDEDGVDNGSDDDDDEAPPARTRARQSRESRQLDDGDVDAVIGDGDADDIENGIKRAPKNRASRESRQLHDVDVIIGADEEQDAPPKRNGKTRASRESRQIDDDDMADIGSADNNNNNNSKGRRGSNELNPDEVAEDSSSPHMNGNSNGVNGMNGLNGMNGNAPNASKKSRGSIQMEEPVNLLSGDALQSHNQAQDTVEKATHKKSDTMTSDSSAYRAFMSVD